MNLGSFWYLCLGDFLNWKERNVCFCRVCPPNPTPVGRDTQMGTDSHDSLLFFPPESPGQVNHSLFLLKPPFVSSSFVSLASAPCWWC